MPYASAESVFDNTNLAIIGPGFESVLDDRHRGEEGLQELPLRAPAPQTLYPIHLWKY